MINTKKERLHIEESYKYCGEASNPIVLAVAGISYPDPTYKVLRQMSDAYSFEYVYEGEGTIQHGEKIYNVSAGDFFILHQNAYHHYYANPQKPWKKIFIFFTDGCTYIKHLIDDYKLSDSVYFPKYNISDILEKCLDEIKNSTEKTGRNLEFLLHSLIAEASDFEVQTRSKVLSQPERLKEFLDRNVNNRLLIKNCCDFMNLDKS